MMMQEIFKIEPNLRITIQELLDHNFFSSQDWSKVNLKEQGQVPFVPDFHDQYAHLLLDF
jgi:hypothetical protein